MAEPGLSELITTTLRNRTKILKDNIGNNNAVFSKMKEHGCFESVSGGRTLVEEVFYAENASFMWYEGGQVLNTSYNPVASAFESTWRQACVSVSATGLEVRQNAGPEGIIKLVSTRTKAAESTMMNKVNEGLLAVGTEYGGKTFTGLGAWIAKNPTTGTIGGVDRSSAANAWARNYYLGVAATFGANMSAANCKQVFTRAKIQTTRGSDGVDLWLDGNSYYEYINQAAQASQMLTDSKLADLGFENVVFNGQVHCLAGGVNFGGETLIGDTESYGLATKYVKLKYHKDCFMDPLEDRVSINQDATLKYIALMAQVMVSAPRLCARVFDS